jgi:leucyl aminopeptidase
VEVSTLRREDYAFVAPTTPEYDVRQVNAAPSAQTQRGHQFPAAVMLIASGLDKHGVDSADPIAYTHIDIAGSSNYAPFADGQTTGAPIPALVAHYVL